MSEPTEPVARARGRSPHTGKLLVSLVVAASFAWLLHAGALPLAPARETFSRMEWWPVVAYVAGWSAVHFVRAARWRLLLEPLARVPLRRIVAVSMVGFAAITLLPVRMGEAVRPLMIRKEGELSGWAATGTIAAERIIDGLVLCLMLLGGLWSSTPLSPLPDRIGELAVSPAIVPGVSYAALGVFAAAFALMGLFYYARDFARTATLRLIGPLSPKAATWLADKVEHVAVGLGFLPQLRYSVPFVLLTLAYWLANSACTWFLARSTGFPDFTFGEACVTTGVVALGILVPNAPGFFGAFQFSFYAALAVYYPPSDVMGPGALLVLLVYSGQLVVTFGGGIVGALLERTGTREVLRGALAENLPQEPLPE